MSTGSESNATLREAHLLLPSGKGRPSHARLRTVTNRAYYALFYALREHVAAAFKDNLEADHAVRRLLEHGAAREVLNEIRQTNAFPWSKGRPSCNPHLLAVAESFPRLQDARHIADYDHSFTPSKQDAVTALQLAEEGIRGLDAARAEAPDQLELLCIAMLATQRTRKFLRK